MCPGIIGDATSLTFNMNYMETVMTPSDFDDIEGDAERPLGTVGSMHRRLFFPKLPKYEHVPRPLPIHHSSCCLPPVPPRGGKVDLICSCTRQLQVQRGKVSEFPACHLPMALTGGLGTSKPTWSLLENRVGWPGRCCAGVLCCQCAWKYPTSDEPHHALSRRHPCKATRQLQQTTGEDARA